MSDKKSRSSRKKQLKKQLKKKSPIQEPKNKTKNYSRNTKNRKQKIKNNKLTEHKWLIFNYVSCHDNTGYIFQEFGKLAIHKNNNCIYLMLIDIEDTGLYHVKIDNDVELNYIYRDKDELTNIKNFIYEGLSKFQSKNYAFIYSGHGDCFYLHPKLKKYIHIVDLNRMLKSYNILWDIVIMDCCLMSSIECIGELQDTCRYLLASESYGSEYGFCNKNMIKSFNDSDDPIKVSNAIIKEYLLDNVKTSYLIDATLIEMKNVKHLFNELNKINAYNIPEDISSLDDIKVDKNEPTDSYLDLYELINIIGHNPKLNILIKSVIVTYKQTRFVDKLHGISICPTLSLYNYPVDYFRCWAYKNLKLLRYLHNKKH